ncbi:uncharacterized protein A1O9_00138 [Exophiala aquamarina CBS 119918]|uniref:Uncharacterized protein n=1 Tax=Exophiala aquamarina CBS 119918 TaxID=1182545 RepID=A0A072PQK8_9EURO|nr:uncharacterized protein A1O9_00138 [Exophiala aquamarina CBS 119918]KEF62166.1 hypothetical protein A1O9_00138 [Exophiala aquamarina CBS 119918]
MADPRKIDRILREKFHPKKESGMLNTFLYDGQSVMDLIHLARGHEIRSLALEGWNKVKPKDLGRLKKDPDMTMDLEKYMDRLTDAKNLHKARVPSGVVG